MKNLFILLITSVVILSSCDKIDNPIPKTVEDPESWDDSLYIASNPAMRKIVLEEYTGHRCQNCPNGAKEVERLDSIYDNQLIPVSIHSTTGGFAEPLNFDFSIPPDGILDYTADYRTDEGNDYAIEFGISGIPKGAVSRLNNSLGVGMAQWEIDIEAIKNDLPKVSLELTTLYNRTERKMKAVVNTTWLSTEAGSYNLQIYLLEDSILGDQIDGSTNIIQSYMHRHMLRKAVNGTWGSLITSSNIGDSETIESIIELDPNWNEDHCIVVAYIYKSSTDYEIIQAEELHIIDPH